MRKTAEIHIYGAEQICASCVNLPSSKETYEWLEAAISRKFPNQSFHIAYYDILNPPEEEDKKQFCLKVVEEDLFYPVVVINGEIVAEGNPRLKDIYKVMEDDGYKTEQ